MIRLELPMLAPSVNHAYLTIKLGRGTKRVLTADGRKFKREALAHLAETYPFELGRMKPNRPYAVLYVFQLVRLQNAGWPKTAQERYKHTDTTNRFKMVEDVLVAASAVDDCNFILVSGIKVQGDVEKTTILIWDLENEGCPLHDITLRSV